jgi:hypothetical protein
LRTLSRPGEYYVELLASVILNPSETLFSASVSITEGRQLFKDSHRLYRRERKIKNTLKVMNTVLNLISEVTC